MQIALCRAGSSRMAGTTMKKFQKQFELIWKRANINDELVTSQQLEQYHLPKLEPSQQ